MSATREPAAPTRDATDDQPAPRPPRYRGYRLDGPIQEFHRALDALMTIGQAARNWDPLNPPSQGGK